MKIDIKKIMEMNYIKRLVNSNFVGKIVVNLIVWAIVLIPTYMFFLIRWGVDPVGFWQELGLLCVFGVFVGWIQVWFIFIGVAITFMLIFDEF